MWPDVVVIILIAIIIGGALLYIFKQKKKGVKCIGCPYSKECNKKKNDFKNLDNESCSCGCNKLD